ncbi:unnamed protein product [Chrysodeixis includens]|uniref:DUF7041 domain-containing protein n=1 Tax=Chrysodeixis includens TaxID=689277 RepID=A0A9N8KUU7_CHRIL|nr:unnamed protein product [Chrysodeixis includens]
MNAMDAVPLPIFSSENVSLWLAQNEAAFALNGIISDLDKYHFIITRIPVKYLSMVEDIVMTPPREDDQYDYFKHEFIKRMSVHKLKNTAMGNMKPSEYLAKLKKVADKRVPMEFLLTVWFNNLPAKVREIVCLEATGHVDTLTDMADKTMALLKPQLAANGDSPEDKYETIKGRLEELTKHVRAVQMMLDGEDCDAQPAAAPGSSLNEPASPNAQKNIPNKIVYVFQENLKL